MWDNPRRLNMVAGALVGMTILALTAAAALWLLRSPLFPVTAVEIAHAPAHTTRQEIAAALEGRIAGNFFAVDPGEVRAALEALPWVRRASVRRVWPDRLSASLEEHVALARWGEGGLLSTHGERFPAESDLPLPALFGPPGAEREMARRYVRFAQILVPLGARPERLVLTSRHAWQLRLDNGLQLMLGRDAEAAETRLLRFVAAYPATLGRIPRPHEYVDLRYPNGFALRVSGIGG